MFGANYFICTLFTTENRNRPETEIKGTSNNNKMYVCLRLANRNMLKVNLWVSPGLLMLAMMVTFVLGSVLTLTDNNKTIRTSASRRVANTQHRENYENKINLYICNANEVLLEIFANSCFRLLLFFTQV